MTVPVSVVMPVYNRQDFLPEAVESILNQTFRDYEFIIVDDCSTDNTLAIVLDYQKRDAHIRIHHQKKNSGIAATRNTGLQLATGKYIAWMDSDDVSMPDRIEKQFLFMQNHPEVGVLGTAAIVIDEAGQHLGEMEYPLSHTLLRWALCFYDPIINPTTMIRRDLLLASGGYSLSFPPAEDYDMWVRLSRKTQLANLPERLLLLRKHSASASVMHRSQQLENSTTINCAMISAITGRAAPISPLELAWTHRRISNEELAQVIEEIRDVYGYFSGLPLTSMERKYIRHQTAIRLASLLQNCSPDINALKLLIRALRYDPFAMSDILKLGLNKIFKRQP